MYWCLVYVFAVAADGNPLNTSQVDRSERNHIHVHYLPARRDPADHIAYGANALLGRIVRSVQWDNERVTIRELTTQISESLSANPCIDAFSASLASAWSALHKGSFYFPLRELQSQGLLTMLSCGILKILGSSNESS